MVTNEGGGDVLVLIPVRASEAEPVPGDRAVLTDGPQPERPAGQKED